MNTKKLMLNNQDIYSIHFLFLLVVVLDKHLLVALLANLEVM